MECSFISYSCEIVTASLLFAFWTKDRPSLEVDELCGIYWLVVALIPSG